MGNSKTKILWTSPNGHILIATGFSFYNSDEIIYLVYTEHRNYRKFNSRKFYNVNWCMERWEYDFDKSLNYALNLKDEIIED